MRTLIRTLVAALVTGLVVGWMAALGGAPATAGPPRMYHTISSSSGYASLARTRGCERTQVFVSSSVGKYAARPGPVGKQGLTGVDVRVTDLCSTRAAAAGGGVVRFEAEGQDATRLVTDNRLRGASVTTDIAATDGQGHRVTVHLRVTWTATGPLEHTTSHSHARLADGNVSSAANDLRRPVTASLDVGAAGVRLRGTAGEANLEQTKSHCIEVPRPGVRGFYPCFGFPG